MEFLPVAKYLLAFAGLATIGAPIAALAFRGLPRRGAAFAIPSALVPLAIAVFWIGQVTFGSHAVVLALVLVVGVGVLAHHRGASPDWGAVVRTYAVFAVGFSFLVVLRTGHPGVSPAGGEQFLHFGIVKAIERAPSLPPEDVWYAGEPLRYYYGGQLQVTGFAMLTGTPLRYGFNLGIAAFYGVLFVVAYGLAGAVAADRGRSFGIGGALGAFLVALGGPTTTAVRLATPLLPDPISGRVARRAFGFTAARFFDGDLNAAVAKLSDPDSWTWWFTRYVVPGTIQEVPLYSFVKADLHGHALSTGYVLFAGALAYAYYAAPAGDRWRRTGILVAGLGAVAGVFGFMNTWALPTAGGLAALAVGAADAHPATLVPGRIGYRLAGGAAGPGPTAANSPERTTASGGRLARGLAEGWRIVLAGVAGLLVVAVGVAVASPFLVFGRIPTNEGIGLFPPRSPLGPFLVVYGGLLALFAVAVFVRGRSTVDRDRWILAVAGVASLLAALAVVYGDRLGVVAVTVPLLGGAWLLVRSDRGGFGLVLLVAGVGLVLSMEFVHARLPRIDPPRWNTTLKVAVQGWTLGAAGAAVAATTLVGRWRDHIGGGDTAVGATPGSQPGRRGAIRSWLVAALVVAVLLASGVFPVLVVHDELGEGPLADGGDPAVDAGSYLTDAHPDQAAAIRWLDRRPGTPTIVEAPGRSYDFTSSYSTFTGLPTVIGWDHQAEYRGPAAYERRVDGVDAIYAGNWTAAARALERYDVAYVVVGPNERDRYESDLRAFDRPAFSVAYENDAVTIYRVDRDRLGESDRPGLDRPARGAVGVRRPVDRTPGHPLDRRGTPPDRPATADGTAPRSGKPKPIRPYRRP